MEDQYFTYTDTGTTGYPAFYTSYANAVNDIGDQMFLLIPKGEHIEVDLSQPSKKIFRFGSDSINSWIILMNKIPHTKKAVLHIWNDQHLHEFTFYTTRKEAKTASATVPESLSWEILNTSDIPHIQYNS